MWKGIYPVAIGVTFLSILLLSISPISDFDLWWHLATGKYILESGQVPMGDIFSHTVPGKEWIDHEWLSQVLFYQVYLWGGFAGVVLLKSAAVLATFYFLFKRTSAYSDRTTTTLTILTVIFVSHYAWLERPMIFTFLFTSIYLYALDVKRPSIVWILPFLTVLWVNLHGGFIVGLLILLLYALGSLISGNFEDGKRLFVILFVSILASLANPYTYKILIYPFQYAGESLHTMFIIEWQPPKFHSFSVYESLLLLSFVALVLKKEISPTEVLLLVVFTHLSLFAVRNVALYGLVCTPIILKCLIIGARDNLYSGTSRLPDRIESALVERALPGFVYTGVILSFILFIFAYFTGPHPLDTEPAPIFPEKATEYILENRPQGELYNHFDWGAYCTWALYPEYRVFIDGRLDVYGDFIYEYLKVHRLDAGWDDTLDKYNVSLVLIPTGSGVDTLLGESPSWELAYRDDIAVVYIRSPRTDAISLSQR
jgi:hypothetical protein